MSARTRQLRRAAALPVLALVLVAAVLGVQLAAGGGGFAPTAAADPCSPRAVASRSEGIEALTEQLVLLGLDAAACDLGVSREALVLDLATGDPTEQQAAALHAGLLSAVRRMAEAGTLPPASALVDEALESADLNPLVETAVRALPDAVVDVALPTDEVLTRAIDELDVDAVLADLADPDDLDAQVEAAVTQAVRDTLTDRITGLL